MAQDGIGWAALSQAKWSWRVRRIAQGMAAVVQRRYRGCDKDRHGVRSEGGRSRQVKKGLLGQRLGNGSGSCADAVRMNQRELDDGRLSVPSPNPPQSAILPALRGPGGPRCMAGQSSQANHAKVHCHQDLQAERRSVRGTLATV